MVLTQMPRESQVPLTIAVRNPWQQALKLSVYQDSSKQALLCELPISDAKQSSVTQTLDASRWPVGHRDFYWELSAADTNELLTAGYWPVEIESPIALRFWTTKQARSAAAGIAGGRRIQGSGSCRRPGGDLIRPGDSE
jgi:hypothetical protein